MLYLTNALALSMLADLSANTVNSPSRIEIRELNLNEVREALWGRPEMLNGEWLRPSLFTSAIGHPQTAEDLTALLGHEVPCARINVPPIESEDQLLVAQRVGSRLAEGETLNAPQTYRFFLVTLQE